VRVDDMTRDDLDAIAWSGSASHLRNVAGQLDRRDTGVVEYLVVRDEDGSPVAKVGIDYEEHPGAGGMLQLATRADLEGRGLATMLILEAERRIHERGLPTARLSVEPDNERARRLYDHLGYTPTGEREIGWEHELEDGSLGWYSTVVVDMAKRLSDAPTTRRG
jgi:ribosomal protein S18 acetylase RimI-like enzyme